MWQLLESLILISNLFYFFNISHNFALYFCSISWWISHSQDIIQKITITFVDAYASQFKRLSWFLDTNFVRQLESKTFFPVDVILAIPLTKYNAHVNTCSRGSDVLTSHGAIWSNISHPIINPPACLCRNKDPLTVTAAIFKKTILPWHSLYPARHQSWPFNSF
jgi:hypothetical protein